MSEKLTLEEKTARIKALFELWINLLNQNSNIVELISKYFGFSDSSWEYTISFKAMPKLNMSLYVIGGKETEKKYTFIAANECYILSEKTANKFIAEFENKFNLLKEAYKLKTDYKDVEL
jgi:hypothetical protein